MKHVLLFVSLISLAGCYSRLPYPTFDLREPIYIIQKTNYRRACEAHGLVFAYRRQIIDGIGIWFQHLPPKKRPQIILAEKIPVKTKNEIIFIDYDRSLDADGEFQWTKRPLAIIVKEMILGKLGQFLMAHEFGHAILGVEHRSGKSIMHKNTPALKASPEDIRWLHKKHPELSHK